MIEQQFIPGVTIAITTKNRWNDLRRLVQMLQNLGLASVPMILVDDGSDTALGEEVTAPLANCRVTRFEKSAGLVQRRNELVDMASTPLVLSLDDDSCVLAAADLQRAVAYMHREPRVAILAFPIFETQQPPAGHHGHTASTEGSVLPIKEYVGCGHLLRRSAFLEVGGYRAFLHYMCEERDLAMRLYRNGYDVHLFEGCPIMHWCSPAERNLQRISYFRARNITLIWLLNAPGIWGWLYALRAAAWLFARACIVRQYPLAVGAGFWDGVKMYWARRAEATPLSPEKFSRWIDLLSATRLFPAP
jgi:GT2 family glycosyltransferase